MWIKPTHERDQSTGRLLNKLFIFLGIIGATCPFLTAFHHYVFPDTPSYFTSLVDNPGLILHVLSTFSLMLVVKIYLATVIPLCDAALLYFCKLYELCFTLTHDRACINVSNWYLSVYTLPVITNELRTDRLAYKTIHQLRSPYVLAGEFRKLEILHKNCMEVWGTIFLPFQFFIGQIAIYACYTIVKDLDHLDFTFIMFSFYSLAAWVIVLECSGRFCKNSEDTIKSWRSLKRSHQNNNDNNEKVKYLNRFKKSCRPLKIGTQGYYSVSRLSVLKFIQGMSKGTLRITLTLTW